MEAIHAAFRLEIANQFTTTDESLTVTLFNGTRAVIGAPQVTPATTASPHPTFSHDTHTYHYTHQADGEKSHSRLTLHNMEECRVYLDDVCHTFLNATIHDNEVVFPDGTAYLVTVTTA